MGLYLCIFDDDDELDGVEVGDYADFGELRNTVVNKLEWDGAGTRFPTLILHSDCDGEWSASDCKKLEAELEAITAEFKQLPPKPFGSEWQKAVVKQIRLIPKSLYDCFIDVDGEPLLKRMLKLAQLAQTRHLPILFQ
jgi:hypothetical protein